MRKWQWYRAEIAFRQPRLESNREPQEAVGLGPMVLLQCASAR